MRRGVWKGNVDDENNLVVKPLVHIDTKQELNQESHAAVSISDFVPKKARNRRKDKKLGKKKDADAVVKPVKFETAAASSSSLGEVVRDGSEMKEEVVGGSSSSLEQKEVKSEVSEGSGKVEVDDVDEVGRRLEEVKFGFEEAELSEEELRSNDQLQEDELLVLQAIYGDNIEVLSEKGRLRSFQIHINMVAPEEVTISAELHLANENAKLGEKSTALINEAGVSTKLLYNFKVNHLPPITLTCILPKSYPTRLPPCFTISVQWLELLKISSLCHMLDSIWMDQPGQEIVYQWAEWLQTSAFSYTGLDKELILGPYGILSSTGDRRAISGITSPDLDIPLLMNYNDEKCRKIFSENLHECCICFSEYTGAQFVKLPCEHFFCWKCMETFVGIHVKEGTVNQLLCPDVKCGELVPLGVLKCCLNNDDFERWETLTLQKTLDSMSDVVYCPKCETACIEDEQHLAQCSKCYFSFCTLCMDRRHLGIRCMTPEQKLQILQNRQGSSQLKADQRRREKDMINEILSMKEVLRDAKQCPSCKMAISKIEGCNKMVCKNCGQFFCYSCNKAINGYDHFRDSKCEIFPREMIVAWEQRVDEGQIRRQVQAEFYGHILHTCPLCRQPNPKVENNNHILCWACQSHYCYLCRKVVRRSSEHFGPKGCRQHSIG